MDRNTASRPVTGSHEARDVPAPREERRATLARRVECEGEAMAVDAMVEHGNDIAHAMVWCEVVAARATDPTERAIIEQASRCLASWAHIFAPRTQTVADALAVAA